ncbi:MAG: hypothetical protein WCF23_14470 [Candidatus Nitrosopolaris sp.]
MVKSRAVDLFGLTDRIRISKLKGLDLKKEKDYGQQPFCDVILDAEGIFHRG